MLQLSQAKPGNLSSGKLNLLNISASRNESKKLKNIIFLICLSYLGCVAKQCVVHTRNNYRLSNALQTDRLRV